MGLPELACTFLGLHGTVAMVVKETPVMGLLNLPACTLFEFARNRRHGCERDTCDGAAKLACAYGYGRFHVSCRHLSRNVHSERAF